MALVDLEAPLLQAVITALDDGPLVAGPWTVHNVLASDPTFLTADWLLAHFGDAELRRRLYSLDPASARMIYLRLASALAAQSGRVGARSRGFHVRQRGDPDAGRGDRRELLYRGAA